MERCGCEVRGEERQVDGGYVAREGGEEGGDGSRGAGGGLLSPVRSGARIGQPRQRMYGTWSAETGAEEHASPLGRAPEGAVQAAPRQHRPI